MGKKTNGKSVVSAGAWYVICNVVLKGLTFLTAPIFNRILSQGEVGEYSNVLSWANILLIVMTWELYSSVSNAKIDFRLNQFDEYMSSTLILNTVITGFFTIIAVLFRNTISAWLGIDFGLLMLLFLSFFASSAISLCLSKYRVFLQYKQTVFLTIVMSVSSVVCSLVLVVLMDDKYVARVIGSYAPTVLIGIVAYVLVLKKSCTFKLAYCKYVLGISVPLVFHVLAGTILNSSDRIIIKNVCGNEDTALYSVAYMIASIVQILWTSVSSAWIPWCYDKFKEETYDDVNKSSKIILIMFAILTSAIMLAAPEALLILGGTDYVKAMWVVPPVLTSCLVTAAYTMYVNVEQYYKKTIYVALGTAIAAILNIVLNYIFVPKFGYIAAAYTTLISFLILFVFHFLITKCLLKKSKIYNTRFILRYLAVVCVILPLMCFLYTIPILRYCIVIVILIIMVFAIYRFRGKITSYLSFHSKKENNC